MGVIGEGLSFARFMLHLGDYVRHPITLAETEALVRRRMDQREDNFLRLVERAIFGYPRSPYLPLLRMAGCELGDLRAMVRQRGLESTLAGLRAAGVYISFEEAKGREPIVRGGLELHVQPPAFDNPFLSTQQLGTSGGSTGAPTSVGISVPQLEDEANLHILMFAAHGMVDAPMIVWRGMLPDRSGVTHVLSGLRIGHVAQKWYAPVASSELRPGLKYRLVMRGIVWAARLAGAPMPAPESLPLKDATVVAHAVANTLQSRGSVSLRALVSTAMRVSLAARHEGLELTGAVFVVAGEPPTPAKAREIELCGARLVPMYGFAEAGRLGVGCATPVGCNDLHFAKDRAALIQQTRRVPGTDIEVSPFLFTSLLPSTPKILLNVENDDYGTVEERACGCPLEGYGFSTHVRDIRSFGKLTGEGVTLVGSVMLRILEEVLPAKFGGSAIDYQLSEEEDDDGFTRLSLIIDPRVELGDEEDVVEAVLGAMRSSSVAADVAQAFWRQAGTLRVRRTEPIRTARGKLMPLHLERRV